MKTSDKKKSMAKRMYAGKKGKGSLEIPKGEKNEGNTMMEGKNEHNRS